jgi:hypothetical protein
MKQIFSLFFFLAAVSSVFAQNTVRGKVTDQNGEPLAGVSVLERGTSNRDLHESGWRLHTDHEPS